MGLQCRLGGFDFQRSQYNVAGDSGTVQHAVELLPGGIRPCIGPPASVFPTANGGFISLPNNISDAARPHTLTLPVVYAYNATIQRQLSNSISVSAAYVGNSGRHAPTIPPPTSTPIKHRLSGCYQPEHAKPYFASYGWTQSIGYFCNCAVNQYNSLQASVDIRNYHGYTAQGTYLYERAYGDGTGGNLSYTMLYNRPLGYGNEAKHSEYTGHRCAGL